MAASADLLKELRIDRKNRPKRRRRWPWVVGGAVVLLGAAFVLGGNRPLAVETAQARAADTSGPTSVLDASGYVTARRLATVSAKITGKVREVLIEEGMRVEADQVLARLDDTDAQAQRDLARSQLAATEAQLADARAQLKLAELTLTRNRDMVGNKLVPVSAVDQAQADRDSKAARLVALQRQIDVARDQLALADISVDNTIVRAPFAGVIIAKAAQPGEMISPISAGGGFTRTGIGTLVDMDSLEVQVDVNEAYIGRVQSKQPVEAVLNAYPEWKIPGSVIAIIPTADRTKATVKVRIALDSQDSKIVPDMGVRVSFLQEPDPDAPPVTGAWVPARAVVGEGDGAAVFVLADGVAKRVAVKAGETRDADRRVDGLRGGETVILSPPADLRDGRRVAPKQAPAKSGA